MRAGELIYHFRELTNRFLFSLQQLSELMHQLSDAFSRSAVAPEMLGLTFQAGTAADPVLSYLGTLVDDVAQGFAQESVSRRPERRKHERKPILPFVFSPFGPT
jgi:hypothetical protein